LVAVAVLFAADVLSADPLFDLLPPQAASARLKPRTMNVFFILDCNYGLIK
jgi:hypothetical protein